MFKKNRHSAALVPYSKYTSPSAVRRRRDQTVNPFGPITYLYIRIIVQTVRLIYFLHIYIYNVSVCMCWLQCATRLMKTCVVQLISLVYLRMCSRSVLRYFYFVHIFFPSLQSLCYIFICLCARNVRNFFPFPIRFYTRNRTPTKARRPQKNPLFISDGGVDVGGFYASHTSCRVYLSSSSSSSVQAHNVFSFSSIIFFPPPISHFFLSYEL